MIRHRSLELAEDGIVEWIDGRREVRMRRSDVRAIEVCHGIRGLRAMLQLFLGAILAIGACVLAVAFSGVWDLGFGDGAAPLTGACVPVMMLGVYVMWFATRPGLYLAVHSTARARKLLVGTEDIASLVEVLSRACRMFGYRIVWRIARPSVASAPYR